MSILDVELDRIELDDFIADDVIAKGPKRWRSDCLSSSILPASSERASDFFEHFRWSETDKRHEMLSEIIREPSHHKVLLESTVKSSMFRFAMKSSIRLAQYFGYFPERLAVNSKSKLSFGKWHWMIVYSALVFFTFCIEFLFVCYEVIRSEDNNFISIATFLFHLEALLHIILFFRLARDWPSFTKQWEIVETKMANYEITYDLRKQLNHITITVMLTAAVDHCLVNAHKLQTWLEKSENAQQAFEQFFISGYPHIFGAIEYSFPLGVIAQLTNLQRTFLWSYADLFIMLVGSALTFKVHQFARRVQAMSQKQIDDKRAWQIVRNDYAKLTKLCRITNKYLSSIIIVSFLFNLYFTLIQLFSSFIHTENVVKKVYYLISVFFISIRVTCICVYGGHVYEEWLNITSHLNSIPSAAYNLEAERLTQYVLTCPLALTGNNFFNITRSLILKIAGAIVTYELVLIQFYDHMLR